MSGVDVVVPCYNYARFLPRCVDALLAQQGVDVRVLVIDDASKDGTPEVGRALAARDARVTFRRHETNLGHIATYNEGLLGWASAPYSLLISADDVVAPGAFARATAFMDAHPEVGVTYGMARVIRNDDAPPEPGPPDPETRILDGAGFLAHCCALAYCPVSTPTAIVRTSEQHAVGGYTPELPHSGDLEMWMRFALRGSVGVLRATQAYYRWHDANMGAAYYDRVLGDRREFMHACERVLDTGAARARFPDAPRWLAAMRAEVGRGALRAARVAFDRGDVAATRAWFEFATEVAPALRGSRAWWRSRASLAMGPAAFRALRAVSYRVRGLAPPPSTEGTHFTGFRAGETVGWWPGQAG